MSHIDDVGAYLLGALDPDEVEAFETALATDAELREEVARLRMAADALPASPEQMAPPPEIKARVMAIVEAEAELLAAAEPTPRTRPRARRLPAWLSPSPALAIAAAALVALAIGASVLVGGNDRTVVTASLGDARLIEKDDDGHATLEIASLDPPGAGRVYQVWLKHEGRPPEPTNALFSTSRDGTASVDVPGSLEDVDAVLVTEEPDGGSSAPTTAPVILARPS